MSRVDFLMHISNRPQSTNPTEPCVRGPGDGNAATMKLIISMLALFCLNACSQAPQRVEIMISEENTIVLNSRQLESIHAFRNEIRVLRRKFGTRPVWIIADSNVSIMDFQNVAQVTREEGLGNIYTGNRTGDDFLLYPIMCTWTNEWQWDSYLDKESEHIRIHAYAGTNIRLLPDGVLIEKESKSIEDVVAHFTNLSGGNRARAVLSADPKARHEDLIKLLKLCREYAIDPLYIDHWIQYISE